MYPIPLTPFPQPLLPLSLTYESIPPSITDCIGPWNTRQGLGAILKIQLLPTLNMKHEMKQKFN